MAKNLAFCEGQNLGDGKLDIWIGDFSVKCWNGLVLLTVYSKIREERNNLKMELMGLPG